MVFYAFVIPGNFLFLWVVWWNDVSLVPGTPANCSKVQIVGDWEIIFSLNVSCQAVCHDTRMLPLEEEAPFSMKGHDPTQMAGPVLNKYVKFVFQPFC